MDLDLSDRNTVISVFHALLNGRVSISVTLDDAHGLFTALCERIDLKEKTVQLSLSPTPPEATRKRKEARLEMIQFNPRLRCRAKVVQSRRETLILQLPGSLEDAERRRHARARILPREKAEAILLFGFMDGIGVAGAILDVSEGGCAVDASRCVDVRSGRPTNATEADLRKFGGGVAMLRLTLGPFKEMEFQARLAHMAENVRPRRVGVKFEGMPKPIQDYIRNLVGQRAVRSGVVVQEYGKSGILERAGADLLDSPRPPRETARPAPPPAKPAEPVSHPPPPARNGSSSPSTTAIPGREAQAAALLGVSGRGGAPDSNGGVNGTSSVTVEAIPDVAAEPASPEIRQRYLVIAPAGADPILLSSLDDAARGRGVRVARTLLEAHEVLARGGISGVFAELVGPPERAIRQLKDLGAPRMAVCTTQPTKELLIMLVMSGFRDILVRPVESERLEKLLESWVDTVS